MSLSSQRWRDTPPEIRDFYRNYASQLVGLCCQHNEHPVGDADRFFNYWTEITHKLAGYHVAQRQWTVQYLETGAVDVGSLTWSADFFPYYDRERWEPATNYYFGNDLPNQWTDVPDLATNFPRGKLKIPKSYWTGSPRRRQNLP